MGIFLQASKTAGTASTDIWSSILFFVVIIGIFYLFMILPQQKKKKKEDKMRNSIQVGDNITTIGGIVGRVVGIKKDENVLILETGSDRSKIKIKKWAIGSVDTIHDDAG
ncbi:MAG TPA: preprotein translocase subunit YajC [Ruminococcaceae bacterium]|jgi:preprotein translocase subunit YajC|nr:preprotein translocase subunit YajC [Oscillospiraceae bacterium]HBG54658.1 preprotein translocase subunit YajC [Oscillospiraceae bacterium]HBQ46536.1 preprotein translocase subunit YajC [Oscillospiraceae bacterium]HCB90677.1 preprotein translocase subunit YajC [Oscillospiraceae bacterium]